jgi:hypothetical protein
MNCIRKIFLTIAFLGIADVCRAYREAPMASKTILPVRMLNERVIPSVNRWMPKIDFSNTSVNSLHRR